MTIRPYTPGDLEAVRSLHERSFPFPDLNDPLYIVKESVELDGKVVGLGLVRVTSEALVILNERLPKKYKAEALKELLCEGQVKCQKKGIDEIHTFLTGCDSESWARVLQRRFGFTRCSGIPLTLSLR